MSPAPPPHMLVKLTMIPFPCVLPCIRHACFLRGVNAAFVFMRVSRQQTNQKLIQLVKYAWRQSRTTPRDGRFGSRLRVCSQTPTQPHIKQRITSRQEISAHPRLERSLSIHSLSPSHDACTEGTGSLTSRCKLGSRPRASYSSSGPVRAMRQPAAPARRRHACWRSSRLPPSMRLRA